VMARRHHAASALLATMILTVGLVQAAEPDTSAGARTPTPAETVRAAVEPAARAFIADPRAAGLSIGVLRGGETFRYHFGHVERGESPPPDDRTLYAIASITKTFTGTLLAQAAVEGKLRLDADVREYLKGAYPNLEFEGHPILVHQLVNHRSGLPFVLPDTPPERADMVLRGQTKQAFFEHLGRVKLQAVPGQAFRYSNAGGQLAGFILEGIYGVSYERLLASRITGPLGMPDTSIAMSSDQRERLAKGYDGEGRVALAVPEELQGAGALKSTLVDMLRYASWHLAEKDPAVAMTHEPRLSEGNYSVGLNWQMLRVEQRRLIWQEGHIPGFLSYCAVLPELGLGLVVLTNAEDRTASARAASMMNRILSTLDERAPAVP
jgi:serine-type D-Ala-D-Ala carboxypeptidase/endopeptidase